MASPDEYDDLVLPILTGLQANPTAALLTKDLVEVLSTDYGLDYGDDIGEFVNRVIVWWKIAQES
jgi:hypothetical protein